MRTEPDEAVPKVKSLGPRERIPRSAMEVMAAIAYCTKEPGTRKPDGYGIEIRRDWILTCEHIAVKKDVTYFVSNAGAVTAKSARRVLAVVLMGDPTIYQPSALISLFSKYEKNELIDERLALIRLDSSDHHRETKVEFVTLEEFDAVDVYTAAPEETQDECALFVVRNLALKASASGSDRGLYSRFVQSPSKLKVGVGDSGAVAVLPGQGDTVRVVGVHHAVMNWPERGHVNRFIPMHGVETWVDETIRNFNKTLED